MCVSRGSGYLRLFSLIYINGKQDKYHSKIGYISFVRMSKVYKKYISLVHKTNRNINL